MDDPDQRPVYLLRLRSEPGQTVPEAVRLRRLLKTLRRAYGFRCLAVEEVGGREAEPGDTHEGGEQGP